MVTLSERTATSESPIRARPRHVAWLVWATLGWSLGYGALRVYWASGHAPRFEPMPDDLLAPGWGAVALCVAAALSAVGLLTDRSSRAALGVAWVTVAAIVLASPLVLLDVVGGLLPGVGVPVNLVSAASRAGMLLTAALLAASVLGHQRHLRGACPRCGRVATEVRPLTRGTPRWAFVAAYAAVAGCLLRIAIQLVVGFGDLLDGGAAMIVFEVAFVLAGVLLPTALVHRFGLVWPRWVLPLAGRKVPRWLTLGPGLFVGVGLSAYFGISLGQMLVELATGGIEVAPDAPYGPSFLWVAVTSYFVWGVGVAVATVARLQQTRPPCRRCGTGLSRSAAPAAARAPSRRRPAPSSPS